MHESPIWWVLLFHHTRVLGGTPEGQARANEDSWAKLLVFLDKYLRN
jgi:hypothetical protein